MTLAPSITIFVRHSEGCKYAGDEFCKRCNCRKHFRWTQNGEQYRKKAGTRSWAEAEILKRELEDQLAGRAPARETLDGVKSIQDAVDAFMQEKRLKGIGKELIDRYQRELDRFQKFLEGEKLYTVKGITRELLSRFVGTWETLYPSSCTRFNARTRLITFLKFCYDSGWLDRVPKMPEILVDYPETEPLTEDEVKRLLLAPYKVFKNEKTADRVHALFLLMRWSGLAIRDALTLEKSELVRDKVYRIVTARQKTGVHVSVPIPENVAKVLLKVLNGNPKYFFWSGVGNPSSMSRSWATDYVNPCFAAAKIVTEGHMVSHRLRDTFAVDLLSKGVPLEEVSKLLGHKSIITTERHYARWVKGRQDRLDDLVTGTWGKK